MRAVLRRAHWHHLALLLAASALAARPEWRSPWYQDDQLPSVFRTYHTDLGHHAGLWFPRVAPDLGFGYGQLLHQVYPPLGFEIATWFHALGFGYLDAVRAFFTLCLLSDAFGMYCYTRLLLHDRRAAVIAALAYVWSPYVLLDAHKGGDFGESLGIALLPWALAALHRLCDSGGAVWLAPTAIALAAVHLGHNITSLFFTGLACLYVAVLAARQACQRRIQSAIRVAVLGAGAIGLSLALAAVYWAPALLEIQYSRMNEQREGSFGVSRYLHTLPEVIQPSLLADYDGEAEHQYGLVLSLLTLVSITGLAVRIVRPQGRAHPIPQPLVLACLALTFLAVMALQLNPSRPVWDNVPLVSFAQFPRRLFLFASLAGAPLIGLLAPAANPRGGLVAIGIGLALASTSLPGIWIPRPVSGSHVIAEDDVGIATQADRRFADRSAYDDFFPAWVRERASQIPQPASRAQSEVYATASTLPPPTVTRLVLGHLTMEATVSASEPSSLTLHQFYFPGWQATVDGLPIPVAPSGPLGLVQLQIPPGQHLVLAWLDDTPLRRAAACVSLLAALATLALAIRLVGLIRVAVALAITAAVIGTPWLVHLRSAPPPRPVEHVETPVTPNATLLAFRLSNASPRVGDDLDVELSWLATAYVAEDQQTGVVLESTSTGARLTERWSRPNRNRTPTSKWILGEIVPDFQTLRIPSTTLPGRYRLLAGIRGRGSPALIPIREIEIR
ncbi:MAG: 6-pyruvoyl-tetrahydropterin synthase-related protein [Chloroflexota bacterium]